MSDSPVTRGNRIVFVSTNNRLLDLRLDGSLELKPGLEPATWQFSCVAADFKPIRENADWRGQLRLYNSPAISAALLGVTIDNVEIVDVELGALGVATTAGSDDEPVDLANQAVVAIEYKVTIADFRHRLKAPRGGLLVLGEINKKPINAATNKDANKRYALTNAQLMRECFTEMGLTVVATAPKLGQVKFPETEVAATPVLLDLDWKAAHPAEELSKILKTLGLIAWPTLAGGLEIGKAGVGADPDFTQASVLSDLPNGSIDRRATKLLITSAPNAIRETVDYTGISADGLEYCWYDLTDQTWKRWEEITYLRNFDPETEFQQQWPNIQPVTHEGVVYNLKAFLELHAFRCVRLNPDYFSRDTRLFHYVSRSGKAPMYPTVQARIPLQDPASKQYTAAIEKTTVSVAGFYDNGRVLCTQERLMNIQASIATAEPRRFLVALRFNDVSARLTWDGWDATKAAPKCYRIGFEGHAEAMTVFQGEDLEQFSPDAKVCVPDLILHRLNGEDENAEELAERALELATSYLPSNKIPRRVTITGFYAADLSPRITRLRFKQSPPMTEVEVDDFASPKVGGFKAVASSEAASQERQSVGAPGYSPPAVQIAPSGGSGGVGGGELFYVKLAQSGGSDGGLTTKPSYKYIVRDNGDRVLGTDVIPTQQRPNGSHLPAETGIARYKSDGSIMLVWCDEVPDTGECDIG